MTSPGLTFRSSAASRRLPMRATSVPRDRGERNDPLGTTADRIDQSISGTPKSSSARASIGTSSQRRDRIVAARPEDVDVRRTIVHHAHEVLDAFRRQAVGIDETHAVRAFFRDGQRRRERPVIDPASAVRPVAPVRTRAHPRAPACRHERRRGRACRPARTRRRRRAPVRGFRPVKDGKVVVEIDALHARPDEAPSPSTRARRQARR